MDMGKTDASIAQQGSFEDNKHLLKPGIPPGIPGMPGIPGIPGKPAPLPSIFFVGGVFNIYLARSTEQRQQ